MSARECCQVRVRALVEVEEDFIVMLRERRPPGPGFAAPLVALISG